MEPVDGARGWNPWTGGQRWGANDEARSYAVRAMPPPTDLSKKDALLWDAYSRTLFEAELPKRDIPIRVGKLHPSLDAIVTGAGHDCWCFITAWNPASQPQEEASNRARNRALASELKNDDRLFYPGRGRDPEGKWPAEESFLVLGLDRENARATGERHGQNAVVWGKAGAVAELLDSRPGS